MLGTDEIFGTNIQDCNPSEDGLYCIPKTNTLTDRLKNPWGAVNLITAIIALIVVLMKLFDRYIKKTKHHEVNMDEEEVFNDVANQVKRKGLLYKYDITASSEYEWVFKSFVHYNNQD